LDQACTGQNTRTLSQPVFISVQPIGQAAGAFDFTAAFFNGDLYAVSNG
jgi:hypothetical protein